MNTYGPFFPNISTPTSAEAVESDSTKPEPVPEPKPEPVPEHKPTKPEPDYQERLMDALDILDKVEVALGHKVSGYDSLPGAVANLYESHHRVRTALVAAEHKAHALEEQVILLRTGITWHEQQLARSADREGRLLSLLERR